MQALHIEGVGRTFHRQLLIAQYGVIEVVAIHRHHRRLPWAQLVDRLAEQRAAVGFSGPRRPRQGNHKARLAFGGIQQLVA